MISRHHTFILLLQHMFKYILYIRCSQKREQPGKETTMNSFGEYIREKRKGDYEREHMSLRELAAKSGISPVYLSNIENGRRTAPDKAILERLAAALRLDKEERQIFYDLAAESKGRVAEDLPGYINANEIVRVALRMAKDVDATDEEWQEFIEKLRKREKQQNEEWKDEQ